MPAPQTADRSIEFRDITLGATAVLLRDTAPHLLADELHKMLGGMPDFFKGEAAILDFAGLKEIPERIDWAGLLSLWRRFQVQPIGVRNLPQELAAGARQAGLALLDEAEIRTPPAESRAAPREASAKPQAPAPAPATSPQQAALPFPAQVNTMFIERPVRSGQQVYARGGDLVLLAGMSSGSEVIADGSIHCYGPLRGRALAGAQGNTSARIIATNFGPEIVSINGVYKTFEQGIPDILAGIPVHIRLAVNGNAQQLKIEPLQLD